MPRQRRLENEDDRVRRRRAGPQGDEAERNAGYCCTESEAAVSPPALVIAVGFTSRRAARVEADWTS